MLHVVPSNLYEQERKPQRSPIILHLLSGCKDCRIQESSIPHPPASAPFWPDPAHRVVVVHFSRESRHLKKGYTSALLLVPYSTLKSVIEHVDHLSDSRSPRSYGWNQWAQRDALLLTLDIEDISVRGFHFVPTWSYGSRVCVLLQRSWESRIHLLMFDLNPWAVKNARRTEDDRDAPSRRTPADSEASAEETYGQKYCDWFCIRRALLPYVVYHGPRADLGDHHHNDIALAATHNGFVVLVGGRHDCNFRL